MKMVSGSLIRMNDKQKKFIDSYNRLCDWHYSKTNEEVKEHLSKCELSKKELEDCLAEIKKGHNSPNEDYVLAEFNDVLYENETSGYFLEDLKDDDIVKYRDD